MEPLSMLVMRMVSRRLPTIRARHREKNTSRETVDVSDENGLESGTGRKTHLERQ